MKNKIVGICVMTLMIGTVVSQVSACTGFTYSDNENVLGGHNEDWNDPDGYIRFLPAEGEKYGCMFIEFSYPLEGLDPDWYTPLSGMNDQGLFYDGYYTPFLDIVNSSNKPTYFDFTDHYRFAFPAYCLANCATVEEVLSIYGQYNLEWMEYEQTLWADRTGASLIIEGDDIVYKEGNFQVVTNFLQTHPELGGRGNAFERYDIVFSMLVNMTKPSVEYFNDICNATHSEDLTYPTVHSYVYDLNQCILYLNHFHNYENVIEINLNEELAKGEHVIYLPSLFEPENNNAPIKPENPTGPTSGKIKEEQTFNVQKTTDPDEDRVYYCFDWDDGTDSGWITPPVFGSIKASHTWKRQGDYEVRVIAKDIYGKESEWSDPLSISMPKNKSINTPFLSFLENHPHMFPLLRQIFGLQ